MLCTSPGRCLAARPVVHGGQAALEVAAASATTARCQYLFTVQAAGRRASCTERPLTDSPAPGCPRFPRPGDRGGLPS